MQEKEADLVVELEDGTIFHLEIQSTDDKEMPNRMLQYALLIQKVHKKFPLQMVLYVGEANIEFKNSINAFGLNYKYEIRNIKDIDCKYLIESDNINDNVLSILCNVQDIDKLLERLKNKLMSLDNKKREDYLRKITYLLRLRPNLNEKIQKINKGELAMPFIIEKTKDPLYKEGLLIGVEKGIEKGNQEAKLNIAKKALMQGIDIDTIIMITGLDREKLLELKSQI